MELDTIGIDLLHGGVGGGQEVFAQATAALHSQHAGQVDWYGSLRRITFYRASPTRAGSG